MCDLTKFLNIARLLGSGLLVLRKYSPGLIVISRIWKCGKKSLSDGDSVVRSNSSVAGDYVSSTADG
jgi:hypothetical protein